MVMCPFENNGDVISVFPTQIAYLIQKLLHFVQITHFDSLNSLVFKNFRNGLFIFRHLYVRSNVAHLPHIFVPLLGGFVKGGFLMMIFQMGA